MRRRRTARRLLLSLLVLLVAVAVALGTASVLHEGRLPRVLGGPPSPSPSPSATPTPPPAPVLPALSATRPVPTAAGLARVLAPVLRDRGLGGLVGYAVSDAETGQLLTGRRATAPGAPASVNKLVTAAAALAAVGPRKRLVTTVVAGDRPGTVVLVGGGDPTLSRAGEQAYPGAGRIDVLARQVRAALGRARVTRVLVDGSAYVGPTSGPRWDSDLVGAGDVAPITAVMVDGGRLRPHTDARTPTPDLAAGRALATALGVPAVPVHRGAAPVGGRRLGAVHSAPLATLVEQCLQASDNVLAEALARLVAGAGGEPASFAGAAAAVAARLTTLGVDLTGTRLVDGSGLSRADRLTPRLLVGVLAAAASGRHPQLRPVLSGLPVAGFSGTLDDRFVTGPARLAAGQVRAKTGTLSGVSTLAGITVDADGRLLAFAVLADRVPVGGTRAAEAALDRVAARLARCGCR